MDDFGHAAPASSAQIQPLELKSSDWMSPGMGDQEAWRTSTSTVMPAEPTISHRLELDIAQGLYVHGQNLSHLTVTCFHLLSGSTSAFHHKSTPCMQPWLAQRQLAPWQLAISSTGRLRGGDWRDRCIWIHTEHCITYQPSSLPRQYRAARPASTTWKAF
ncbi:hypothetical protein N657DRAFT_409577 [Parathielavia appendiculata]|uniref:Uncharacterized protein n=1 Tax=Parathielavia appendiculata TaxID=2587402 RepID=A0AAN6Z326_9PEZI|nr:hypothetical protein N657DRAFT_409577 [Parathielavia appendiculata]